MGKKTLGPEVKSVPRTHRLEMAEPELELFPVLSTFLLSIKSSIKYFLCPVSVVAAITTN